MPARSVTPRQRGAAGIVQVALYCSQYAVQGPSDLMQRARQHFWIGQVVREFGTRPPAAGAAGGIHQKRKSGVAVLVTRGISEVNLGNPDAQRLLNR